MRNEVDIEGFIAELMVAGWEYTSATVYAVLEGSDVQPDHELVIGADSATGLGAVRYAGDSGDPANNGGEWFSVGERVNPDGVRFVYFGTGDEWPGNCEVPLAVVKAAMVELMTSQGKRPASVVWQVWE
ncbi:Imm1 family immunity protein [Actinokineospora sp. 24-640]